jgi:hypothetical protein
MRFGSSTFRYLPIAVLPQSLGLGVSEAQTIRYFEKFAELFLPSVTCWASWGLWLHPPVINRIVAFVHPVWSVDRQVANRPLKIGAMYEWH